VKVALVTGMLFAFQPELVRYSGQVRSEACYILFLMCALCLGWRAISSGKYRFFALHGLFATLAYLTRPEGMGLLLVMAAWVLMGFPRAFRLPWRRRLACVLAAFAPTLILAGAYVAYISTVPSSVNEPWHVRLTLKRQLSDFLAGEYISDEFRPGDETLPESMHFFVPVLGWLRSYVELAGRLFCKDLYPLLALLLVLALARRRENPRDGPFEFFVFGNVTFYLGIFAFVRVCHRLPVQLVAPLLFLPALGVLELVGFARTRLNLSGRAATRLGAIILIVLAAAMTQQFVSPERAKRESVKLAGQWIRENSRAENPRIATDLVRVVFYAEGTRIDPPLRHVGSRRSALDRSKLQQMIRDGDADYLAICPEHLSAKDMEYLSSAPGLNFVASFKPALEDGQEVTLFEFSRDNRSPGNRAEPARD
jgi:hypothetical protein